MPKNTTTRVEAETRQVLLVAAIPNGLKAENIKDMGKADLLRLKRHYNLGDEWENISIPHEWLSSSQSKGDGTIRLASRMRQYADSEEELDLACITLMRMVLLCMTYPSKTGVKGPALLDITTILSHLSGRWIRLAAVALQKPPREDGALFARLSIADVPFTTPKQDVRMQAELRRFRDYARQGLWSDWVQDTSAVTLERESTNRRPKRDLASPPKTDPFWPLPDAFVLETGKRAVWLMQQVLPQALHVYEHLLVLVDGVDLKIATNRSQKYLRDVEWDLGNHAPFTPEPYEINVKTKKTEDAPWPPRDRNQLYALLRICQTANYFIVALSGGERAGEFLSFKTDCLTETPNGIPLINGKTYKLETLFEGKKRDWPMPEMALQAVQYQIQLAQLVDRSLGVKVQSSEAVYLWRLIGGSRGHGNDLRDHYNEYLREFTDRISTTHLLDKQSFTNHRFRKTIARLVALAMVHAPKILMDIFGHKSVEMTMHYIMTDPTLRTEIQQIQKELLAMTVRKAIENADSNGGPAAKKVKAEVQRIKFVRAREDLQADDIDELVLRWTAVNREWTYARKGVLCTKMRDQVGPCAKGRSTPNPARCSSGCEHRLEEAEYMGQVDGVLEDIVKNIQIAQAQNNVLLLDVWEGQLHAHINRFDALYEKWSKDLTVAPILARHAEDFLNAN